MRLCLRDSAQIDRFREVVALMKCINEEQTLHFVPEGMMAETMDPSHVAMIQLNLKAGAFDEYEVSWTREPEDEEEGEGVKLTMNLTELEKRLRTISAADESLSLEHDEKKAMLNLHIRNDKTNRKRRFGIALLEPLEEEVPEPKIVFKATGRILFADWERGIRDAELVSEHIRLAIAEKGDESLQGRMPWVHFQAKGDLDDSFLAAESLGGAVEDEDNSTIFVLSYLSEMTKAIKPIADVIEISLRKDMPLKLALEGNSNLEANLYLAPVIGV